MPVRNETSGSVVVEVQLAQARPWSVPVPVSLCRRQTADMSRLLRLVCDSDPTRKAVPSKLRLFTFAKSPWDSNNIEALLDEKTIILAENVASIPAERAMSWHSVPAARILTEPQEMPAQVHHLAPVFTYLGEPVENSFRALRGPSECEKRIDLRLFLPSQEGDEGTSTTAALQDYIGFLDTGDGMTLDTLKAWAKLAAAPQEFLNAVDAAANVAYYADGNFSCFGVGSKYAAFLLGASILVMTRPKDPASEILQMRVTKADLNSQEQTAAGSFHYCATTRQPHSREGLTVEELNNEDMLKLIKKFDDQPHGTLFLVTGLHQTRMSQLKAKSFEVLHTYLTGTYFYLCVPGERPASETQERMPARANFMHGPGYKYGPINFTVSAVGFTVDGPDDPLQEQVHRLGKKPWTTWPAPAETVAERKQEDVLHALGRIMESSCFETPPKDCPQVHGSKFVFGVKIPGAGDEKDAFAILHCHYMPNLEGAETMKELGLPPNVRWLPFWKGRLMQYPDLTALLPIMTAVKLHELVTNRLVIQMFLPGVVGVDRFKTKFLRPLNDQLENLPDKCYYNVDEAKLYKSTEYGPDLFIDGEPGPGITWTRKGTLQKSFGLWLTAASNAFDDQWEMTHQVHPTGLPAGWNAYEVLEAKHKGDTFRKDQHMMVAHLGAGAFSWYRPSTGAPQTQQKFVGSVAYFRRPDSDSGGWADAKAMLSREPTAVYGNELFEFSIYKLERADAKIWRDEEKRAREAAPHRVIVSFDASDAPRLQDGASDRPIQCLAKAKMPAARVDVQGKQQTSARRNFKITHWTSARDQDRRGLEKLSVHQRTCFSDGPSQGTEVFCVEAALMHLEQEQCFVFDDARLRLPRPGNYTAKFTVTTLLRGGVNMEISKTIHYKAVAGDVHSCLVGGLPQGHQLGVRLTSLYLEFKDSCGNFCRLSSEPEVTLSSQQLALRHEAAPHWAEPEPGRHRFMLPAVSVAALDTLVQDLFTAPNQPASIASGVAVTGTMHRQTVSLQQDFVLQVLPGLPAKLAMQPQPDWFSESEAVTLANHSTVPQFTLQLLDAAGLKTTPFAQGDRAVIRLQDDPAGAQQSSLSGNEVDFDEETGTAVVTALHVSLPAVTVVTPVKFVASYWGQSQVSEYTVPAEVHPCTNPFVLRFFLDAGLSQQVPFSEADSDKCVLRHTAGEAVEELYMTVNNEAGDCLEVTDVTTIKVGKKAMAFEPRADAVVLVNWGQALKLPDSTRDVKNVEVKVRGKAGWHLQITIKLQPISGPGIAWSLRTVPNFTTAKNGETLSSKVVACVEDRHHNVASLPDTFHRSPPRLSVSYQPVAGQQALPGLGFMNSEHGNVYGGNGWQLLQSTGLALPSLTTVAPPDRILVLPEMALVGPPGKVQLTISGSAGRRQQLAQGTLPLELRQGPLHTWQLNNEPSGTVMSHMRFEGMSFTAHDAGNNQVDLPTGDLYVELSAGSTSGPLYQATQRLAASKRGKALNLDPVTLVCRSPGTLSLQLVLKRKQGKSVKTLSTKTIDVEVALSNQIVTSLKMVWPPATATVLTAGDVPPCFRFGLRVEDGSSPLSMQQFIPNFTATLKLPDNTSEQLPLRQDDASFGRLLSRRTDPWTKAGSYEVLLHYIEPQAEALGLPPTEAALQLRRTFAVSPGPAHELRLGMAVDARKCLNAGRVADRIVLPQTTLSILDRHSNVVTQAGSTAHMPVNIAVLDALGHEAIDSSVIALSSNSIQIPEAAGQVSVSACSVSQGQAGSYILELAMGRTAAGAAIHPVRLPFEVIDASEETEAVSTATTAVHGAEHQLTSCKNTAASRSRQLDRAGSQIRPLLAQVQEILPMAVDDTNWEAVQQHCQVTQQQTRIARLAKHQHRLSRPAEQRLRTIPGVIGYVSEFVFVENERYARLLSWQTSNYLSRLLVEDSATRLRLRDANIPGVGSSPAVLLLSKLRPMENSTGLPHTDSGCVLPGMHDVVRLAQHVCVCIPSDCMPGSSADNRKDATAKLLQAVVGEFLYMPTEAAASLYSEAVFQQLKRRCWPILCQDSGALITSSGLEGGDVSHNAPAHLGSLPSYYGQVSREQTQQWRNMTSALGVLQQVAGCIEQKRQAQARCREADDAVRTAQFHLQQRQDELRAAKAQTAQLQQLLSTTNAADVTNALGGMNNGEQASKRNHAAATATDETAHSPALISPPRRNKAAKAS